MKQQKHHPLTAAVLLALAVAPLAYADDSDMLETVSITATKRTTTVQDTAGSISAVSAADIANRGIADFNALAQSVPGISMRSAGPGQTEFEMRGLNSSGGNTSMVGFYLDETPLSSPASAQLGKVVIDPNLYDLERVEVLRGPQGTLYGSSSMGGTVKLVPTAPQLNEFDASGETKLSHTSSGGGLNETVNSMVNLPIGSSAALRIVGSITNDSGWIQRNVFQDGAVAPTDFMTGSRPSNFYSAPLAASLPGVNTTDVDSVRASLLWKPTNTLTITPSLMWQLSRQGAPNTVDVNGTPQYPTVPAVNAHWEIYDTPEPQTDRFGLASLKVEYQFDGFTLTSATADWTRSLIVSQDGSEETGALLANVFGVSSYDLAGGASGPTPYGSGVTERDYTRQFTQELRLASTTKGPLQWIGGYYYQKLNSDWSMYSQNPGAPTLNPAIFGSSGVLGGLSNIYVDFMPQVITQNSFFGELSYELTPELKATLGLRHYNYNLSQTNSEWGMFSVNGDNSTPYNTAAGQSASGTDPKLDISWKLSKDALVYFTAAKGFRLGGANQPIPTAPYGLGTTAPTVQQNNECGVMQKVLLISGSQCGVAPYATNSLQAPNTFSSDTVWNYEVGEKLALLDGHLQVNTSAYLEKWQNPQIATNLSGFGLTVNGSDARIIGLESEIRARLPQGFEVSGNLGYTNATFNASNPWTGYTGGMRIPDTPELTGSLVLLSRGHIGSLRSTGSVEYDYVGTRTNAPYGETIALNNVDQLLVHLPAYALVNARYGVRGDNWGVTAFVNNVFNKEVLLDTMPQINIQGPAFTRYTVNQPRTIGLDLTYSFGR